MSRAGLVWEQLPSEQLAGCTDYGRVPCAHCGEQDTHQRATIHCFCEADTVEGVVHISVAKKLYVRELKHLPLCNPSARRDGVRIVLECEHCPGYTAINISQHKGVTLLSTERLPDAIHYMIEGLFDRIWNRGGGL